MNKRLRQMFFFVFFASLAVPARATTDKFSAIFYHPAPGAGDFVTTIGTGSLRRYRWRLYTAVDYGFHPIELTIAGVRARGLIDNLAAQRFGGGFALTDWLELNAELPVIYYNSFSPLAGGARANQFDIGDVRLQPRLTLWRRDEHPVGIGFAPFVTLPTGNANHYVGESTVTGGGVAVIDADLGSRFAVGFNAGIEARESVVVIDLNTNTRFIASLGASAKVTDHLSVKADVTTATALRQFYGAKVNSPTEVTGALEYKIGRGDFRVNVGGGGSIVKGAGQPLFHLLAGLVYEPQTRETRDRNKIVDLQHGCPDNPADFNPKTHDDGCPKYYELKSIADILTDCPAPEKFRAGVTDDRCRKVYDLQQNYSQKDIETIYSLSQSNLSQKCPDPSKFNAKIHSAACPKYYDLKASGKIRPIAERQFVPVDSVKTAVYFASGSASLNAASRKRLTEAAEVLQANKKAKMILVSGHTDAVAGEAFNQRLSERRAKAASDYLISKGVARSRIDTKGFGENRPVDSNATPAGRQRNRRVEISY